MGAFVCCYSSITTLPEPSARKWVKGTMNVGVVKKTMDLMPAEGTYKGKTLKGLYAFGKDTDTLTICLAEPDKDRPKGLDTGEGVTVAVYRRKK